MVDSEKGGMRRYEGGKRDPRLGRVVLDIRLREHAFGPAFPRRIHHPDTTAQAAGFSLGSGS